MFGRRSKDDGAPGQSLRERAVLAESSMLEQALTMATSGGQVVVAPASGGFDGKVVLVQAADGWHAVTVGLSSPDVPGVVDGVAGRGFELSMELAADAVDLAAGRPWVVDALSAVAELAQRGSRFGPGSRLASRTPLDGDPASTRTNLLFVPDTRVRQLTVPSGEVIELLQLVPVDDATLERAKAEGTDAVIAELREASPLLTAQVRP